MRGRSLSKCMLFMVYVVSGLVDVVQQQVNAIWVREEAS